MLFYHTFQRVVSFVISLTGPLSVKVIYEIHFPKYFVQTFIIFNNFECYSPIPIDPWQFGVDQIDPALCTHLVYSFAILDEITFQITPMTPAVDIGQEFYKKFTDLKSQNPSLKTMLAFGGWGDSNINDKYSQLVSSSQNIETFVLSVVQLLVEFNFDGLDVDWEYPKTDADKVGFINLLVALKTAFAQNGFILSVAVPGLANDYGK